MSKPELLAPVGDWDCLLAAVQNGADSVYFGATLFNARTSAKNFDLDTLKKAIEYCKIRNVNTFLTLNILIKNNEFKDAISLAKSAYEFGIDGIIVQDLGLATFLIKNFPDLPIHASTQMTVHNLEGVKELSNLGFKRVVLAREVSIDEIKYICKNSDIEIEAFIHGALCISYSGQCLFSSTIGGRSGNRGECAGPCRLPYKLLCDNNSNKKETVMDNGYLLSPKDLCALEYLPELINAGVKCFKIEGRLKSPEYVATVTRIYRKYIDKVFNNEEYIVEENDTKDLLQIFNRGGFSTGHLNNKPNKDLIFKERPNNIGLFLGNISKYNPNKGHITLTLNENLQIGDSIYTEKGGINKYTVSELMQRTLNITNAKPGMRVTIGRMKGDISVGDKVYKLTSKSLMNLAQSSYANVENKKININCTVTIKENTPISISANYNGKNISVVSDVIPVKAINAPITEDRIIKQISKTGNTPFNFKNIKIDLDDGLYIPNISILNELRRNCINKIEEYIIQKGSRKSNLDINNIEIPYTDNNSNQSKPKISILLRKINSESDYTNLNFEKIQNIYIPLKLFIDKNLSEVLTYLSNNTNTYIYLPTIIKNNYKNILKNSLEKILSVYNIKGFVISNLSNLKFLDNYLKDYEIIGNSSLNVFNYYSMKELSDYGLNKITLSRELDKTEIDELLKNKLNIETEQIVYGYLPIMSCNYCFLGQSNNCYPECKMYCKQNNTYYLQDRLGFKFKVVPDSIQCITSIFHNKPLNLDKKTSNVTSFRIDILDENINEINKIIEQFS